VKKETGDWKRFRERFGLARTDEVDLHFGRRDPRTPYWEIMDELRELVANREKRAQQNGRPYLMFVHGWSTSRAGQTIARSAVRGFMRSTAATPFIERAKSIQHETVFPAKIRPAKVW
jgi:hypothetical protein